MAAFCHHIFSQSVSQRHSCRHAELTGWLFKWDLQAWKGRELLPFVFEPHYAQGAVICLVILSQYLGGQLGSCPGTALPPAYEVTVAGEQISPGYRAKAGDWAFLTSDGHLRTGSKTELPRALPPAALGPPGTVAWPTSGAESGHFLPLSGVSWHVGGGVDRVSGAQTLTRAGSWLISDGTPGCSAALLQTDLHT